MKKIFIILTIFIYFFSFSNLEIFAYSKTQMAEISKIENELYGFDYINDELSKRVSRLEKSIYGREFSGDVNKRIKNISKDMFSLLIKRERLN